MNVTPLTREQFQNVFAKLDYDGDKMVTLSEMKNFVADCLDHQDIMLISIVWIGYLLNPKYEEHEVLI